MKTSELRQIIREELNKIKNMKPADNFDLKKFITEGKLLKENNEDIISFLSSRKDELLKVLSQKFKWDEEDLEDYQDVDIVMSGNSEGEPDSEIAGFEDIGLDFSFNPSKVKDEFGDAYNFKLKVGGKTIYGISYDF